MLEGDTDLLDDLLLSGGADQFFKIVLNLRRSADDDEIAGLPHLFTLPDDAGDLRLDVLLCILKPWVLRPNVLVAEIDAVHPFKIECKHGILPDPILPAPFDEPSRCRIEREQAEALPELLVTDEGVGANCLADGLRDAKNLLDRPFANDQGSFHLGAPADPDPKKLPGERVEIVDVEVLVPIEYLSGQQEFHDSKEIAHTSVAGHICELTYLHATSISITQRVVTSHPSAVTIRVCSA